MKEQGARQGVGHAEAARILMENLKGYAIFMLDKEGRVASWSSGAEQLFGYRETEILEQHFSHLFTPESTDRGEPQAELSRAARDGKSEGDRWFVHQDGSRVFCNGVIHPLRNGELSGFAVILRDLTETQRATDQLRLRNQELALAAKRKDEFLAMLAHELRNPLAPIRNSLYIMKLFDQDKEAVDRARIIMERQVKHLIQIVDDLLEVSRLTRGKIQLRTERLDLGRLVHDAADDHRHAFERFNVTLKVDSPEVPVWVVGDATRLAQVLDNLLQNALMFTPGGGRVTLSVAEERARGQAAITVRDTGVGIDADMLPRLFDSFSQGDASLDRSKGGLGLGLTLVKGLVDLHGGTITVASAGVGKGAAFTIRLPIQQEPAALTTIPAAPGRMPRSLRVLVVEDNHDAADSLRLLLELAGHEVSVAKTGPEGLQRALDWRPNVVLCDIGLPGMDGYRVVRELRRTPGTARTRVIAVTGYGSEQDQRRSRLAGFDHHLTKPVDPDRLQDLLVGEPSVSA